MAVKHQLEGLVQASCNGLQILYLKPCAGGVLLLLLAYALYTCL